MTQLIAALNEESAGRQAAIPALARRIDWHGARDGVAALVNTLHDADPAVRRQATRALHQVAEKFMYLEPPERSGFDVVAAVVDALLPRLSDAESAVRKDAAEALGQLADDRAVEPLNHLLRDDDPTVRKAAVTALEDLGEDRDLSFLRAARRHVP